MRCCLVALVISSVVLTTTVVGAVAGAGVGLAVVGVAIGIGIGVGLVVGVGGRRLGRRDRGRMLVGVHVDRDVDGEFVGAAGSWPEPVCSTTREPTTVAQSEEGLLATLVHSGDRNQA